MILILIFSLTLLLAVLVSSLAQRSILSSAVLFLAAGFLGGRAALGILPSDPDDPIIAVLAETAIFSVLFTDGMKTGIRDLAAAWRLPGRALLLGMPITLALIATFAHLLLGMTWPESLLVGAALSPTDPVFAAAIVGREEVPLRLRHLLGVESGLNDGLALPLVLGLLAWIGQRPVHPLVLLAQVGAGVAEGVAIVWIGVRLERSRFFEVTPRERPLAVIALGLLVLSVSRLTHANEFLAAFAAGVALASSNTQVRDSFREFGDLVAELLKLAALLVFAGLLPLSLFREMPLGGYAFALLVLLLARPIAIGLSLIRSGIGRREWVAAAWFGPRGFASVLYGLLIWRSGVPRAVAMFEVIALAIVISILAHSSTDVVVARWLGQEAGAGQAAG